MDRGLRLLCSYLLSAVFVHAGLNDMPSPADKTAYGIVRCGDFDGANYAQANRAGGVYRPRGFPNHAYVLDAQASLFTKGPYLWGGSCGGVCWRDQGQPFCEFPEPSATTCFLTSSYYCSGDDTCVVDCSSCSEAGMPAGDSITTNTCLVPCLDIAATDADPVVRTEDVGVTGSGELTLRVIVPNQYTDVTLNLLHKDGTSQVSVPLVEWASNDDGTNHCENAWELTKSFSDFVSLDALAYTDNPAPAQDIFSGEVWFNGVLPLAALDNRDGQALPDDFNSRDVEMKLPFFILFDSDVTAFTSLGVSSTLQDFVAVVDSATWNLGADGSVTGAKGRIEVITSINAGFALDNLNVVSTGTATVEAVAQIDATDEFGGPGCPSFTDADLTADLNVRCVQRWEIQFASTTACTLSGIYQATLDVVANRENPASAPDLSTSMVSFNVTMEDDQVCELSTTNDAVLSAAITRHASATDRDASTETSEFFQDADVFFRGIITSPAAPIAPAGVRLDSFTVTGDDLVSYDLIPVTGVSASTVNNILDFQLNLDSSVAFAQGNDQRHEYDFTAVFEITFTDDLSSSGSRQLLEVRGLLGEDATGRAEAKVAATVLPSGDTNTAQSQDDEGESPAATLAASYFALFAAFAMYH